MDALEGYTLEQPQAFGIVGVVGKVWILGISLLTKGQANRSFMGLVVIIEEDMKNVMSVAREACVKF